jgi:hypothetical protein
VSITDLFRRDPTRQLEEVQKVNARERAERDVAEFHETDSAKGVLTELGDLIRTHPEEAARFLYVHATFGSGKTHLLKLIGLVADSDSEFAYLGEELAAQWPGFDTLSRAIEASHVDRFKPVFLNLLDRDASKEPPLSFLVFEAIGRELGYPTDPNWLLEWAWTVDMEYDGVWEAIRITEHDGHTFDDVLEERATLRRWLYAALPTLSETTGTDLDSAEGVKASIERAETDVDPEAFGPDELVSRVKAVTAALNEQGQTTELLLGLDEVALFVGDSRPRYREFEATMEALQYGPNPVVVTTGQYSLSKTRTSLIGDPPADHWTQEQVPLEGADTEIIVRKRWLQKTPAGQERIASLVSSMPDLSLQTDAPVESVGSDPVESYPFREYDLTLLRRVMQELITQGRDTDQEYIQGRALLVLVRSLFTKFDWASASEGALVTWDELFDLLVEETTYVPLWVQEILENTLIPTFGGDDHAHEVRIAKALYLLNQMPAVPATPANLGRLMLDDTSASVDDVVSDTHSALETLLDKRKVLTETNGHGEKVYTLVSEEQESVLSRAQTKAEEISPHQLSAWLETRLRENDDFLRSDSSLHEVDVGAERLVPLRYEYSVLDSIDRVPTREFDALRVRILVDEAETVAEQIETWRDVNEGREGGEHVLVAIEVAEATLDRIRNVVGMRQVLDEETDAHEELEREHRTDKRQLESAVTGLLEHAAVHTVEEYHGERPSALETVIQTQLEAVFGSARKVLSRPLVEVDDAKAIARFFRGSDEWPLASSDATCLGVDPETAELKTTGWCRDVIETYESRTAVDVEAILQQTQTANGDYRGTPQESIAALLITLATSNEPVVLKRDTEYVTEPAEIGRQVRTKDGLMSLQVRFDEETVDPEVVRDAVSTLAGQAPDGDDPDAWIAELERWIADNSVLVKRVFKGSSREFGISLAALECALAPVFEAGSIDKSELVTADVLAEAETFADARELFAAEATEPPLWEQFTETLALLDAAYPDATITSRLRATAERGSVPTKETAIARLSDATGHRVEELSAQYRRITGGSPTASEPEAICAALTDWVRTHRPEIEAVLRKADGTFDGVSLGELESMLDVAWRDDPIDEETLVTASVHQQAETYSTVRELFTGDPSLWAELAATEGPLQREYPESPTTDAVTTVLAASRLPSPQRVRELIAEAEDPIIGGDIWGKLQAIATDLRQELPNADVTDEVTTLVETDDRPDEKRATELLEEAEKLLERIHNAKAQLDDSPDGSVVVLEEEPDPSE